MSLVINSVRRYHFRISYLKISLGHQQCNRGWIQIQLLLNFFFLAPLSTFPPIKVYIEQKKFGVVGGLTHECKLQFSLWILVSQISLELRLQKKLLSPNPFTLYCDYCIMRSHGNIILSSPFFIVILYILHWFTQISNKEITTWGIEMFQLQRQTALPQFIL